MKDVLFGYSVFKKMFGPLPNKNVGLPQISFGTAKDKKKVGPLGRFGLVVAMSMYISVPSIVFF